MTYITLDTNILIYLLDDWHKTEKAISILKHLIENNYIKLLLPRIIIEEWDKHKPVQKKDRIEKLKEFFDMAEMIFSKDFVRQFNKPDNLERIFEEELQNVQALIDSCEIIEVEDGIKFKVVQWGINKKAPMHKKTSMADALLIFTLFNHIEKNPNNDYYFVSSNTEDFYEKKNGKKEIHSDLKTQFEQYRINDFREIGYLIHELKKKFALLKVEDVNQNSISSIVTNQIYNPILDSKLGNLKENYLENIRLLDIIVSSEIPTKQQAIFALELINNDNDYKVYFFRKIKSKSWFEILEKQGYFNPDNNPSPILNDSEKQVYSIPYWEILTYLNKISQILDRNEDLLLIIRIINFIKAISNSDIRNHTTDNQLPRILSNLPNENITEDVLLTITNRNIYYYKDISFTMILIDDLLIKFLSEVPTDDDIKKAKIILDAIIKISISDERYIAYADIHYFVDKLQEKEFIKKIIVQHQDFIYETANKLRTVLLYRPNGLSFQISSIDEKYIGKLLIQDENIKLIINDNKTEHYTDELEYYNDSVLFSDMIIDYNQYDIDTVFQKIYDFLLAANLNLTLDKQVIQQVKLISELVYDDSDFTFDKIKELQADYSNDNLVHSFGVILRELLNELVIQKPEEAIIVLRKLAKEKPYKQTFIKRIVLYIIGQNWNILNSLLNEIINEDDIDKYFSNTNLEKELYDVLNINNHYIDKDKLWKDKLLKIIEQGNQDHDLENYDLDDKEYWQLKWYSALKNMKEFKDKYDILSTKLNTTNTHFENLNTLTITRGGTPPMSFEDILSKTNKEIVELIHNFKPEGWWVKPNISGFSELIGAIAEKHPNFLIDELKLYERVYYIYAYQIIFGFQKAWRALENKKDFQWDKILSFCNNYISSTSFKNNELKLENDSWNADKSWITGMIANLLEDGMRDYENAIPETLLPQVKEILLKTGLILSPSKFKEDSHNSNYPQYLLNSEAGKLLRSLMTYSLYRSHLLSKTENSKWEDDVKNLFERLEKQGYIDFYILLGWYYQYFFHYLDKEWINKKVDEILHLDKEWYAFIGGLGHANPPYKGEATNILLPHYERILRDNLEIKPTLSDNLALHFVSIFLNGDASLDDSVLILKLLNSENIESIKNFIRAILGQSKYILAYSSELRIKYEEKIIDLWRYLIIKYENSTEKKELMYYTSNFICFIEELSNENIDVIIKSFKRIKPHFSNINDLVRLSDKGDKGITAQYIGQIIDKLEVEGGTYFFEKMIEKVRLLTEFLYQNGQKEIADRFCNKLARLQYHFLDDVYRKFNP